MGNSLILIDRSLEHHLNKTAKPDNHKSDVNGWVNLWSHMSFRRFTDDPEASANDSIVIVSLFQQGV